LQKLRSQNEELRTELRQLSSSLDDVLSKQSTSELHHDSGAARQKQLKNAQAQHAAILKEV